MFPRSPDYFSEGKDLDLALSIKVHIIQTLTRLEAIIILIFNEVKSVGIPDGASALWPGAGAGIMLSGDIWESRPLRSDKVTINIWWAVPLSGHLVTLLLLMKSITIIVSETNNAQKRSFSRLDFKILLINLIALGSLQKQNVTNVKLGGWENREFVIQKQALRRGLGSCSAYKAWNSPHCLNITL